MITSLENHYSFMGKLTVFGILHTTFFYILLSYDHKLNTIILFLVFFNK